ncbi:acetyltransferase [Bacillus sp. JCM 19046]|nr:acetyltransferase [Bacillus sp. JCM 19045]GAF17839.1 acetyltransferase [Bacillus sp. JCM 19046]
MEAITLKQARLLDEIETAMLQAKMKRIQEITNNPMEIDIQMIGSTTAFKAVKMPGPAFNTIRGFKHEDLPLLDDLIHFYQISKLKPQFELNPAFTSPDLFRALMRNNYCQTRFHTVLYGTTEWENMRNEPALTIRSVKAQEMDLYADIYLKSFKLPIELKQGVAQHNQVLLDDPRWSFYIAEWDGQPAAVASLFVEEKMAVLAAAATLPSFRQRGIHQQLVNIRMKEAEARGTAIISGQANFGSISQTNMEKSGMKIAYTKGIWNSL